MKFRVTHVLLMFLALICVKECSAWVPDSGLIRKERTVEISVIEKDAHVRIRSVFFNPTLKLLKTHSWWPASLGTKDIKCFINANGISLVEFQDRARLDALADAAEEKKDIRFFRLAENPWTRVFRTTEFSILPNESVEVVLEYNIPVSHQGGFDGIEIFLNDGIEDELFHIEFSVAQMDPIQHFWSPFLSEAIMDRSETGIVALRQIASFLPTKNLRIIWSKENDPEARFFTGDHEYVAHFRSLPPVQEFHNVTLLLDTSGSMSDVWAHVQELLRFLLEHQEERSFRVAFIGTEGIEWLVGDDESFEPNTLALRKKIIESTAWRNPLGKCDISEILSRVSQPVTDHILMIFSDAKDISAVSGGAPIAVLQFFSPEQSSVWKKIAVATKGVVQRAFRSVLGTREAEELLSSVENRRHPLYASDVLLQENEKEILPTELIPQSTSLSPVFVGRIDSVLQSNEDRTWFDWLPRQWAASRIATILETGEKKQHIFSTESLDAILSISRRFGIKTLFFTENTTRTELEKVLITSTDIWLVVDKLWKINTELQDTGIKLVNGVPLWKDMKNIWRSFDFHDRVTPDRWIKIAPFSAAQRQLFVLFPEVFAEPFGVATEVEFCTLFRCFSIISGGRENALPSDRAFVRDFDPNHWAMPFVLDLVEKNILQPELNGKLHLERAVSRGDFVQMLVLDRYGENFSRAPLIPQFTDLLREDETFDAVQFLAAKKIIGGYIDGTFRPKQDLSRAEAVKILLAIEKIIPQKLDLLSTPIFSDTVGWERVWVEEAVRRGMVQGYTDGLFHPHAALSRAEAAKLIASLQGTDSK